MLFFWHRSSNLTQGEKGRWEIHISSYSNVCRLTFSLLWAVSASSEVSNPSLSTQSEFQLQGCLQPSVLLCLQCVSVWISELSKPLTAELRTDGWAGQAVKPTWNWQNVEAVLWCCLQGTKEGSIFLASTMKMRKKKIIQVREGS